VADSADWFAIRTKCQEESTLATQERPKRTGGVLPPVATVVLLLAVVIAIWYAVPKRQLPAGSLRFYTDDDGSTWFADDAKKVPPFQHNGKQAVLARVYQTSDGKQFVAYLEKYSDETRARLDQQSPAPRGHAGMAVLRNNAKSSGVLVKKPHEGSWIPEEDPAAKQVKTFTSPDGGRDYGPATPE
jgi:hypothetical protein